MWRCESASLPRSTKIKTDRSATVEFLINSAAPHHLPQPACADPLQTPSPHAVRHRRRTRSPSQHWSQ